jgi:hypothetical protein
VFYGGSSQSNINDVAPAVIPTDGTPITMYFDTAGAVSFVPRRQWIGSRSAFTCGNVLFNHFYSCVFAFI